MYCLCFISQASLGAPLPSSHPTPLAPPHLSALRPCLVPQALSLSLACLSFDFVGTCLDDSTEDLGTIQVPSAWRVSIEEPATLQLFIDYYKSSEPPLSTLALECLVRMASVRRWGSRRQSHAITDRKQPFTHTFLLNYFNYQHRNIVQSNRSTLCSSTGHCNRAYYQSHRIKHPRI